MVHSTHWLAHHDVRKQVMTGRHATRTGMIFAEKPIGTQVKPYWFDLQKTYQYPIPVSPKQV